MSDVLQRLRDVFGHDEFREGQAAVIDSLLAGRSALAVFPTGGGKSLCYQLPALMMDGLTLVVSPLIALMKDQVDDLTARNVAAARLDSTCSLDELRSIYRRLDDGDLRLLYVAPERLTNERFLSRLSRLNIAMIAVDEAHCISEWGHNFRPDYLKLAAQARSLGVGRVLALTATATPKVAEDIRAAFEITEADHVQTGFRRPNLAIEVTPCPASDRSQLLLQQIQARPAGPTVVYVTQQRTAEMVADYLSDAGLRAEAYHAGLGNDRRAEVQDRFMRDEVQVVVATVAFGMGIDKPDIRAVYHYNLPKTLESYTQEIGRAGRDGAPSVCEMFACADDRVMLESFTYGDTPTLEAMRGLVDHILAQPDELSVSRWSLSDELDMRMLVVSTALTYLELDGVIEATAPFYAGYKVAFDKPLETIFEQFDERRAEFLERVFDASKKGRKWYTMMPDEIAEAIDEPRGRILKALEYLESKGHVELKPSGLRHGYRILRRPGDPAELAGALYARFGERERKDAASVQRVIDFAEDDGCLVRHLLAHFGESMDADCGDCTSCQGQRSRKLPCNPPAPLDAAVSEVVARVQARKHPALAHPRQLARYLAGLSSPMTVRAKLTKTQDYGALSRIEFPRLLAFLMKE